MQRLFKIYQESATDMLVNVHERSVRLFQVGSLLASYVKGHAMNVLCYCCHISSGECFFLWFISMPEFRRACSSKR